LTFLWRFTEARQARGDPGDDESLAEPKPGANVTSRTESASAVYPARFNSRRPAIQSLHAGLGSSRP